jgi:hypothetical protein
MGSRSVAESLFTQSSVLATPNVQSNHWSSSMAIDEALDVPSSGRDGPMDPEDDEVTVTQGINLAATPATASTSAKQTQKQKNKKKQSSTASFKNKTKGKKLNPEDFYMKSVLKKRQAEMTKAQAEMTRARAEVTNAKVRYMKQLKELGLEFSDIKKMVDKEFPPIPTTHKPTAADDSDLEVLDSDDGSF